MKNEDFNDVVRTEQRPQGYYGRQDCWRDISALVQLRRCISRRNKRIAALNNPWRHSADYVHHSSRHINSVQPLQKPTPMVRYEFRLSDHRRCRK